MIDLERAKAICAAATPGPWEVAHWPEMEMLTAMVVPQGQGDGVAVAGVMGDTQEEADIDAAFIADARTLLPAALEEIESLRVERDRLQAANAQMREALEKVDEHIHNITREALPGFEGDEIADASNIIDAALSTDGSEWLAERKALETLFRKLTSSCKEVIGLIEDGDPCYTSFDPKDDPSQGDYIGNAVRTNAEELDELRRVVEETDARLKTLPE